MAFDDDERRFFESVEGPLSALLSAAVHAVATQRAADACLLETKLFEPLTWLEAAIFFSFAAATLPEKRAEMAALARDRWAAYEDCAGAGFDAAVKNLAVVI